MPTMQEALTDALEHPLPEPRRPTRHKRDARKSRESEGSSDTFLWGLIGSVVGSLLVFGMYRILGRITHRGIIHP